MGYLVKEIFYSIQGEGFHVGRPAVFCRFSGCNLWSGRESDRSSAICPFCDTDFVGGTRYGAASDLVDAVLDRWPIYWRYQSRPFVVLTGGEPALQVDDVLIDALHHQSCEVAIETNGTKSLPNGIDWITVSPKSGTKLVTTSGNELKLVFPQMYAEPSLYEGFDFQKFYLQPMDGSNRESNKKLSIDYCLKNPKWSISIQIQKYLDLR